MGSYGPVQFGIHPPFNAANGLIAAHRARAVLMRFDEGSIHHNDVGSRFAVRPANQPLLNTPS